MTALLIVGGVALAIVAVVIIWASLRLAGLSDEWAEAIERMLKRHD